MLGVRPLSHLKCSDQREKEGWKRLCGRGEGKPAEDFGCVVGARDELKEKAPRNDVVFGAWRSQVGQYDVAPKATAPAAQILQFPAINLIVLDHNGNKRPALTSSLLLGRAGQRSGTREFAEVAAACRGDG
jgi:hypothetical protein